MLLNKVVNQRNQLMETRRCVLNKTIGKQLRLYVFICVTFFGFVGKERYLEKMSLLIFFLKFSFFVTSLAPEIISLPRCVDANLREQAEPLRCALPNSTCFVEAQVCRKLKQPLLHHHYNENKKKGNLRKMQEIITSSAYNFQVAHSPSGTVGLYHEQETHKIKRQARPCMSFVYAWTRY